MTEKFPTTPPSTTEQSVFLVPRSNGEIQPGRLTGKSEYKVSRHRDGGTMTTKWSEVRFPDEVGPDGTILKVTKMISEKAMGEDTQSRLAEELHDGLYEDEPVSVEESTIPLPSEAQAQVEQIVDQHETAEAALLEAQAVFAQRMESDAAEYAEALRSGKGALSAAVEDLVLTHRRIEQQMQESLDALRMGMSRPESVSYAVNQAYNVLGGARQLLASQDESLQGARRANQNIASSTGGYREGVMRLKTEFGAVIDHIGSSSVVDSTLVGRVNAESVQLTVSHMATADKLDDTVADLNKLIGMSKVSGGDMQRSMVRILSQLEDMRPRAQVGRLSEDEYRSVLLSLNRLLSEQQDDGGIRELNERTQDL